MSQLVSPAAVATLAGHDDDPKFDGIASEAVDVVSAMAESYCRTSFAHVENDAVALDGSAGRKLILGNPPITDVISVAIDGTTISADDYLWTKRGLLFRAAGWGGIGAKVTVVYSHGFASVPADVAAVVRTAALRLASNPSQLERTMLEEYETWYAPSGFTIAEQITLNRYRRRTLS
jgi:hypothetical protein